MSQLVNTPAVAPETLACLNALARKVLWLSSWTVHNANHLRPARDGLKVGGHQASCASVATLMTALYFDVLGPNDRVAVKPHASPVFHAIQYLFGNQTRAKLEDFRAFGGAQSYPSRTKDSDDVDISTGSVGLGVGMTLFASMVQDYVRFHKLTPEQRPAGRMIAIMGDAELDEGNVYEALLEGWKHDVRNLWWIIDYNRQSLDRVVSDRLFQKIKDFFQAVGWKVVILKHGRRQQAAFAKPGGEALREWIDDCPNELYCALTFKGGTAWRERLGQDIGHVAGAKALLAGYDDDGLQDLMTNLAGHDMEAVLEALREVDSDVPHCFIMYTIKGFGLPFAGHKDNHAGIMNEEQMADFRAAMGVVEGAEWSRFAGLGLDEETLQAFIAAAPFNRKPPRPSAPRVPLPDALPFRPGPRMSTQEAFGRILNELGKGESELAERIVTTSPDVTVSTNLGGWVNQRGIFDRADREDVFRSEKVVSMQKWSLSRNGQHVELGIAENNLFLLLAALGLSDGFFGVRLLPVGTVYDPFIARGLDALSYACYQDARFLLAGTPSGITLAPEGGAHQSVGTPLIGMGQPGLTSFEPAFADELAEIMLWGFGQLQGSGGRRPLLPALDPHHRPAGARGRCSAAARHPGRRLLARRARRGHAPGRGLFRRRRARGAGRPRGAGRRGAGRRPARRHLGGPPLWRSDDGRPGPRTRRGCRAGPCRDAARPVAPRCRARHRARRPSGGALLARHGCRSSLLSAGCHRLRRIRRYPGALRQAPDRHRRHPRHGGTGLRRSRPAPRLTPAPPRGALLQHLAKTLAADSGNPAPCRMTCRCPLPSRLRQFVARLHPHPVLGGTPTDVFQCQCHTRRHAGPAIQQPRQRTALAAEPTRHLGDVPADLFHALADQFTQVRRVQHGPHSIAIGVAHGSMLLSISGSQSSQHRRPRRPRSGTPRASCRRRAHSIGPSGRPSEDAAGNRARRRCADGLPPAAERECAEVVGPDVRAVETGRPVDATRAGPCA